MSFEVSSTEYLEKISNSKKIVNANLENLELEGDIVFDEELSGGDGSVVLLDDLDDASTDDSTVFEEEEEGMGLDEDLTIEELGKGLQEDLATLGGAADEYGDAVVEYLEGLPGGEKVSDLMVPGAGKVDVPVNEVADTSWEHDRDPAKFMPYLGGAYPSGIPSHDGNSMVGCERAILYLTKLNKEISEALRLDSDDSLDPILLEDTRKNLVADIVTLKMRSQDLSKELKESTRELSRAAHSLSDLTKEATTPVIQLVATPFERAVAGILINSVVSGGKPFEDVYGFLKEKYALKERDELAVMQLVMDSGYHIFKDRGSIGRLGDLELGPGGNPISHGVDYIKNYFG